jgi:hypothetical protein
MHNQPFSCPVQSSENSGLQWDTKKVHSERMIFESSKWVGRISQRTKTQTDGSFLAFPSGNEFSGSDIVAGNPGCRRQTI